MVGFVNKGKLFVPGEKPKDALARTAIVKMWPLMATPLGADGGPQAFSVSRPAGLGDESL